MTGMPSGTTRSGDARDSRTVAALGLRAAGVVLCLGVAYIHLVDQHFFAFDKRPGYVLAGYVLLEIAGVIAALLLLLRPGLGRWALAAGVAAGPLVGFVLSRGPGLPDYVDDKGNWTEPLGVLSLLVEAVLLVVALVALRRSTATVAGPDPRPASRAADS
jgi:hypothetical protein